MRRYPPRHRHGEAQKGSITPEYRAWVAMRARCESPSALNFWKYGGRGISVCGRWISFVAFLSDMGRRPSSSHSIDRIDNNGNYEPANCRWATKIEQSSNTRRNHYVEINGETATVAEWARRACVTAECVLHRLKAGRSGPSLIAPSRRQKKPSKESP